MKRKNHAAWIPTRYALLLVAILLFLYFRMVRPQELLADVDIAGDYAYLAVGEAGLRVVDLRNPAAPREAGAFDSQGYAKRLIVVGKNLFLADGRRGVLLLDISEPEKPRLVARYQTVRTAEDVAVSGNLAYVAVGNAGLEVIRLRDMKVPEQVRRVGFDSQILRVAVQGNYVYVADRRGMLWVVEKHLLENPEGDKHREIYIQAPGAIQDIKIVGRFAYLAAGPAGLLVLDLANPAKPEHVSQINTSGFASGLEIAGIYAYVADREGGIRIIDISNPAALAEVGQIGDVDDALDVAVRGDHAFVADGYKGLRSLQAMVQVNPNRAPSAGARGKVRDVALLGQYAFLACEEEGVRVVLVENPESILEMSVFNTSDQVVAVEAAGDYVYAATLSDGLRVLQIESAGSQVDLRDFSYLDTPGSLADLALMGDLVYLADGPGGLRVADLKDPAAPVEISNLELPGGALGVTVWQNRAYVASGTNGLHIIDISNPAQMVILGSLDTPGEARSVAVGPGKANRLLAVVAAGNGGARVVDVTNATEPRELSYYDGIHFVQDVALADQTLFLAGLGDGVVALSLAEPLAPQVIGLLDTPGEAQSIRLVGSHAFLADYDRGLRSIDIADPRKLVEVGFWDVARVVTDLVSTGRYVYLLDGKQGIRVEDFRNPLRSVEVGLYQAPGRIYALQAFQEYLFVAGNFGFQLLTIHQPTKPRLVSSAPTAGITQAIAVQDHYIYLAEGDVGMQILDFADPAKIQLLSTYDTIGQAVDIAVSGNYAFLADGRAGLQIINVADPSNPKTTRIMGEFSDTRAVLIAGQYAYVADGVHGLGIVNVEKPTNPEVISRLDTPGTALSLAFSNAYVFIADGQQGIQVVYVIDPRSPQWAGAVPPPGGNLPIVVNADFTRAERARQFYVYAADGEDGLVTFSARKTVVVTPLRYYETPGLAPFLETIGTLSAAILGWMSHQPLEIPLKVWRTVNWLLTDLFFFTIVFLLWLALTSQYVLPIHRSNERGLAISRLLAYFLGTHGPAIFIKEGKKIAKPGELDRRGAGVMMVDPNSAVLLERQGFSRSAANNEQLSLLERLFHLPPIDPVRVVGPGVAFFSPNEYIRGVVDLRPQFRISLDEPAYTSDGIEVMAHVLALFTLGQRPDVLFIEPLKDVPPEDWRVVSLDEQKEIGPKKAGARKFIVSRSIPLKEELEQEDIDQVCDYYFNQRLYRENLPRLADPLWEDLRVHVDAKRMRSAIYTLARRVPTGELEDWTALPGQVCAEAYRNILGEYTFDDLFKPDDPAAKRSLFEARARMRRQIRSGGVLAFRLIRLRARRSQKRMGVGQVFSEDELVFSSLQEFYVPENPSARVSKILRECGIKVIFTNFTLPQPVDPKVYEQRLASWQAQWKNQLELIRGQAEREALYEKSNIIAEAQKRIVQMISEVLQSTKYSDEALAFGVLQILEDAAEDPETRHLLPAEVTEYFRHLRSWLQ